MADWRERFHLPLSVVGTKAMSLDEAVELTRVLSRDPSSHVAAAVFGWAHPFSREAFVLADLADILIRANSDPKRQPKKYPRPTDQQAKRLGTRRRSQSEIKAELAKRGH